MLDAPHLAFMWQDGKIIPVTDEAVLALRGQRFLGGPTAPRFWLTIAGLFMVLVALGVKINDWRKKRIGTTGEIT